MKALNTEVPPPLLTQIRGQTAPPLPPGVLALSQAVRRDYADSVAAILFYGSCLRRGDDRDGIADLCLLVDDYSCISTQRVFTFFNKLLPPHVFYLEHPLEDRVARAKVAVFTLADFCRGTSPAWFHSYLWGRFAQPTALVYTRDQETHNQIQRALAQAVMTFIRRVLPCLPEEFDSRLLWQRGLTLNYRAELRAERPEHILELFDANAAEYRALTRAALSEAPVTVHRQAEDRYQVQFDSWQRSKGRLAWQMRICQGKLLSLLRLIKGVATFEGGVDYILWKIERHSGVRIEATPRLRRHPLLLGWPVLWRIYRQGGFR